MAVHRIKIDSPVYEEYSRRESRFKLEYSNEGFNFQPGDTLIVQHKTKEGQEFALKVLQKDSYVKPSMSGKVYELGKFIPKDVMLTVEPIKQTA